jgi:hypothetical protein
MPILEAALFSEHESGTEGLAHVLTVERSGIILPERPMISARVAWRSVRFMSSNPVGEKVEVIGERNISVPYIEK